MATSAGRDPPYRAKPVGGRGGIQIGTIDALLAQLCLRHDLTMLTTDKDFGNLAGYCALKLWTAPA